MDAYIVDFARSPYQFARKGRFAGLRPDDLAAQVVRALVAHVKLGDGSTVASDGCLRPQTSVEGLAALKTAFLEDGTVTAGTSSPLTDGASAVLVASEAFLRTHGLKPLAQIKSIAVAGVPPEVMGIGPVPATRKALARAGLSLHEIDLIELNEAFAAQAMACMLDLGWMRPSSTWMAARSPSAIRWARPARASLARPPACCSAPAAAMRWQRSA